MTPALRIVAPACSPQEARAVLAAGADELYCGAMFDSWVDAYGEADVLSRRQGRAAHVRCRRELAEIATVAADSGAGTALVVNARYTQGLHERVLDLVHLWEDLGGRAVLASDLGLILALRAEGSGLRLQVSLLTGVFNSASATLFARLGVSRIVLPRDLTLAEMAALVAGAPQLEYEAVAVNQKCQFMDGLCGFYHAVRLPSDVPADFDYQACPSRTRPIIYSHDPDYEGHGCQLPWRAATGPVRHLDRDDTRTPHCAACQLSALFGAGVRFLKIAGRAYPTEVIIRCVGFLREAWRLDWDQPGSARTRAAIRRLYARTFGASCRRRRCYYADGAGAADG
jgi:putative protease